MVTLTRYELENNALLLIRDVLRQNLVDPVTPARAQTQWIVKGPVKNKDIDLPMVILDQGNIQETRVTFKDAVDTKVTIGIMVWAKNMTRRDKIADDIKEVLQNDLSVDSEGTSIYSSGLTYTRGPSRNADGYVKGYAELLRIKEMDIEFQYLR